MFTNAILAAILAIAPANEGNPQLTYHFDAPATIWEEGLPLGNGRIGMMPDGGIAKETITLNESSCWSGSYQNADNPDALNALPEVRRLLFEDRCDEAQKLMQKSFICGGVGSFGGKSWRKPYGCYQVFGNLVIDHKLQASKEECKNYRRELNLETGISTLTFELNGVEYTREYFCSYNSDIAVIRLSSSSKDAISFSVSLNRESNVEQKESWKPVVSTEAGDLVYRCRLFAGTEAEDTDQTLGMKLGGRVRIIPSGGTLTAEGSTLRVESAESAVILVSLKTDWYGEDADGAALALLDKATSKGLKYTNLKKAQIKAFSEKMDRVNVNLGDDSRNALPINERLLAFDKDGNDPGLAVLYYQFGRYLLVSSTRPGCLPPNLQGIWTQKIRTPWNCDYHLNINLQMNLWPSDSGNLGEMMIPLAAWTMSQVPSGEHTAQSFYGARGWTTHILGNVWTYTAPGESPSWGSTNTCAAWLCDQLYDHYLYTLDKQYLAEIYPMMRKAALFFVDVLVEDPRSSYLVTAPTTSPENSYVLPNGKKANVCAGSTMDNQIIRELFNDVIEAGEILGWDEDFRTVLEEKKSRLMPTTIGEDGRILEWMVPRRETDPHHRHVSHLYGLFPGREISMSGTPELAEAARKSLEHRGDLSTGWSMGWKICFWAHLHDGNRAWNLLRGLLHTVQSGENTNYSNGGGSYPNMFCAHPPFQIDGNFGGAAGIAEMLLQSSSRPVEGSALIELLPALPDAWKKSGSFDGLRARGGVCVSAKWENGEVTALSLYSSTGGEYCVTWPGKNGWEKKIIVLKAGKIWKW